MSSWASQSAVTVFLFSSVVLPCRLQPRTRVWWLWRLVAIHWGSFCIKCCCWIVHSVLIRSVGWYPFYAGIGPFSGCAFYVGSQRVIRDEPRLVRQCSCKWGITECTLPAGTLLRSSNCLWDENFPSLSIWDRHVALCWIFWVLPLGLSETILGLGPLYLFELLRRLFPKLDLNLWCGGGLACASGMHRDSRCGLVTGWQINHFWNRNFDLLQFYCFKHCWIQLDTERRPFPGKTNVIIT